ncbi:MAG: DUF4065 domain-containing protein [Bacteroidetes bacterium]|nr:DUF4065 domain-containing protein [Bacteroidota bacterium]
MKPIETAHYILQHYSNISPMKLQKLLYYVKVWGIVSKEYTFNGTFEKWKHGPVNNEVYQEFKKFGSKNISINFSQPDSLNINKKELIDLILELYTPYTALTLSAMTHQDAPWQETRLNSVITDKSIYSYYSKLPFAKNFPFDPEKLFYPVQSDLHYAFIFDMNAGDADAASVFPSYNEYKQYITTARDKVKTILSSTLG